ncbi:c-type cytochrome [Bradyrhizobium cenepequi]
MRALASAGVAALLLLAGPAAPQIGPMDYAAIERGRYLAIVGDCAACHAGSKGDYAGGRAIETPFGDIYAANITPDDDTGIGRWTAEDFARAMREGKRPPEEHLYPAFPYPYYTKVSREDVDALYIFLRTVPSVRNEIPANQLPFPLDVRTAVAGWNVLFFREGRFDRDPIRSDEWNRGAYLVQGLGHCGACHTGKNVLGGDEPGGFMQGGALQGWFAPDLTSDARTGLGTWSIEETVEYLRTGRNGRSMASGPMAEVIENSTSKMTEADLRAMAVYLKDLPGSGAAARAPPAADDASMRAGAALYRDNCHACHADGEGVLQMFPALHGSQVVQQRDAATLVRIVLEGTRAATTDAAPTAPSMPSFAWRLSNAQVADLLTYIRNSWGNAGPSVTEDEVRQARARVGAKPSQ